jgi:hypothetical protein
VWYWKPLADIYCHVSQVRGITSVVIPDSALSRVIWNAALFRPDPGLAPG